jgi:hypothetical protein
MDRQASVIIADDLTASLVGKFNLFGIYTSDIVIPTDPAFLTQLVFLFSLDTSIDDIFHYAQLKVTLPGMPTATQDVPIPSPPLPSQVPEGRTRWLLRQPILIQQLVLRPGRIEAKVVHDKGEIEVKGLPWISLVSPPPPPANSKQ